ncbi:MAG TPA: hypothetical protein VLE49_02280 [Anaerolineales bacterium]|nr:hypothetical protein [Anaerolineales bacterium]
MSTRIVFLAKGTLVGDGGAVVGEGSAVVVNEGAPDGIVGG